MKRVCILIGTRPEAIKMAPVILSLRKYASHFDVTVCATGQHTTMLFDALNSFGIHPDVQFDTMKDGQSLAQLSSRIMTELDEYINSSVPNLIMVHGDTTSALVGGLVGFYHQIDVGHVEAGLRSNDLFSPFPEEFNRRSVAISAKYNFAPTKIARENLIQEGCAVKSIVVTGNTVIDALLITKRKLEKNEEVRRLVKNDLSSLLNFDAEKHSFILVTAHRRENLGKGIEDICRSLMHLALKNPSFYFVYPLHLNPRVKDVVRYRLGKIKNIVLIPPQGYLNFTWLLCNCYLVLTDSGGIQEEAPALGKPVLVMRDTSERPEAIHAGTAKLVTSHADNIIEETQKLIDNEAGYQLMANAVNPFGDGKAGDIIANHLVEKNKDPGLV